jgi:hypothetical protein
LSLKSISEFLQYTLETTAIELNSEKLHKDMFELPAGAITAKGNF